MRWYTLLLFLLSWPCLAVIETYQFDNEQQRERYNNFVKELRCPKCQNQNIADSNAPIAADLRRELHRLLNQGQEDAEIIDYMVSRYGDFVLYRPPVNAKTIILWVAPLIFIGIGLWVLTVLLLRQKRAQQQKKVLSSEDQQRLQKLLAEDKD